jgi:hypothetical protein
MKKKTKHASTGGPSTDGREHIPPQFELEVALEELLAPEDV